MEGILLYIGFGNESKELYTAKNPNIFLKF